MKILSFMWKNVYVFLFFIFTTITFAQSNNCAATPTLSVGTTCVTTNYNVAGTFTESGVSVSCGTSLRDGWFTFTTDATTTLIDIQGTSNKRLGLAVYSGACGSLTEVPGACTIPNAANASLTNITVTPSTTYRLRLMRTNGPNTNDMTGTICITKVTPPSGNFTCATATTLPCGTTNLAGTTVGSTDIVHGTGCSMSNYGAWYTFVGDGQITTISTNPSFDIKLSIATGSCGSLTNIVCTDTSPETATFTTTNGVTYYVYVAHWLSGSTTTGTFTISRSCSPAPTAPVNDLCVNATSLPCGTSNLAGTTVGTTNIAHGTGCTMSNYGVWYTFVGDGNITTISTNPAFDIKLSIATGTCGSLTNIACTDTSPETATFTAVNGTTYYVYVAHWSSGSTTTGTFTISRTCSAPISNDNCSGAVGVTVNPTRTCTTTTAGTIFGATDSGVTGSTCGGTDDDDVWYSFVATASTHYIELLNVAGSTTDLYHAVYAGTCGSLGTAILCSDPNTSTVTGLTIGNTYFIQIYSWTSTTGQSTTFDVCVSTDPACAGTPIAGTTTTSPGSGAPGSSYTVSATGYSTGITGLTFQWQYSTNGGSTWTNQGAATGTYSNYTATAPVLGTTVLWHLIVTCTASSQSATSTNGTFTSVSTLNVPATGNNSITCGTNTALYDNGGISADYVNNSNGYTVINAGIGATINISGNYVTESVDYIRIYDGTGTGGTLLATYSGTGSINYTGTVGQTLTIQFTSDSSLTYSGFTLSVSYTGVCNPVPCSGTPTGGTVSVTPANGGPGSSYTVSATGMTLATGMTYQWQSNTNGAGWVNVGVSSSTYSNYSATAPGTIGSTVAWQLVVTCTNSGQSATSTNSTFTVVSTLNIPTSGSNTVTCGTNVTLYDNGGASGDYSNNADGFIVLEAGLGATINISGNYVTESSDDIIIYAGSGTGGTILATYSGTGTINYTGTPGQTLTIRFNSDSSIIYSGFVLSVTYSGTCFPVCSGTPSGGTVSTSPNTGWPGSSYTVVATGYTQALDLLYQWQFSTDAGATWTNAGAATSTYSNYSATAPASGLVHWQLEVTCTNSGQVSTSSIGIFTTMVVSDVVTGCPNVVSGGLGLSGADPAAINCTAVSTCVDLEATYLDLGETTDYIVEPILYNPPFAFSGLANPVSVNTDDVWSPIVNLPFDFCFYGNTFNQCLIGSNGVVTFDLVNNSPGGTCGWSMYDTTAANLPVSGHGALIENAIFGVFHDINPSTTGNVGWELITLATGCRALVVSWSNVPMYYSDTANDYTGMMVLYENSNIIEVYVQKKRITTYAGFGTEPMWNDGNAVIGIQNANGTLASVPPGRNALDPNWTATNEAWRFVPNGNSIATIAWHEGSGTTGPVVGTSPTLSVCPTSTTVYTAEITYTLCDGRTIKEIDETTVTINGAKVWNGSVSTDWNVANNWTPIGVPTAMDCVVIADTANDPIISGTNFNGLGLNLTVENNATLTVNPDNYLTITDWININTTGDLVLQNSASLIQINNNANQGTMHMTRTANIRKLDYVYWSSPVTSFNLNTVSPGTNGYKYKWTPTIPTNTNGFGNWSSANETMALGKGYIVRGPDNFTSTLAPFNAVFVGTPNNGTITTPIYRGSWNGGTYTNGVSTTLGTNDDDNWNLIGNPYPSAIDAIDFLTLNTNVDGFINLWTHGTLPSSAIADPFYEDFVYNYTPGDYITYNSSGASAGPGTFGGTVGAGQGFFVLMNHTSISDTESVTFNNSMRSSALDNSQFYRTSNENGKIWLDIIASNGSNVRNLVAYVANATNDRDRMYDAITNEKLNLNLYSLIGNETMKIQGRSLPFDDNDSVPMGIKVPQNGNYTIGIGALDGFFTDSNQNIYLEDLEDNIIHDLRANPYSFTATAGNHTNRFVLRYKNETLGDDDIIADEANLWVISSETLSVKSTKREIESVRVFDVLGRQLAFYPKVNSYEIPLTKIQKNNTGLIIQVTLTNGTIISKKVIY